MAGKFLTIEEAATALRVSEDEVRRLVDRKKLFPMRDGTSVKFKADEVERVAASLGDDGSRSDALALDLDLDQPPAGGAAGQTGIGGAGGDDLAIGEAIEDGDWVLGEPSNIQAESRTVLRGQDPAAGQEKGKDKGSAAGSGLSFAQGSLLTGSDDLVLDSLIAASSPSLSAATSRPSAPAAPKSTDDEAALTLDLAAANQAGSGALSGSAASAMGGSIAGVALSGVLDDKGISLEDGGLELSGIDIASASGSLAGGSLASGSLASGSLAGEAFVLGEDLGEEESASVVIATEDTGDSSFFGAAIDDASASVTFDDSAGSSGFLATDAGAAVELPAEMSFSVWQTLGLACCALLLLLGCLVMIDLAWTIRSPIATPLSAPLLDGLSAAFGWR